MHSSEFPYCASIDRKEGKQQLALSASDDPGNMSKQAAAGGFQSVRIALCLLLLALLKSACSGATACPSSKSDSIASRRTRSRCSWYQEHRLYERIQRQNSSSDPWNPYAGQAFDRHVQPFFHIHNQIPSYLLAAHEGCRRR